MTSRQLFEAVLIELNKENAPNVLLEDFNYFANKAINQYINKRYNIYDINLLTTDDLRVLKDSAILIPQKVENTYNGLTLTDSIATYYVDLPANYLHLLNCIVIYNVKKTYKCYNKGDTWRCAATRLTSDAYSKVLDNYWFKPSYKRPYYYIHNVNTVGENGELTEDPYDVDSGNGTDANFKYELPNNYSKGLVKNINTKENLKILNSPGFIYYINNLLVIERGKHSMTGDPNDPNIVTRYVYFKNNNLCLTYNEDKKLFEFTTIDTSSLPEEFLVVSPRIENGILSFNDYSIDENGFINEDDPNGEIISFSLKERDLDYYENDIVSISNKMFSKNYGNKTSNIERAAKLRYGNVSKVRMEIRYGTDTSVFSLDPDPNSKGGLVYIDYIKAPLHIRLTQEEVDYTEDHSQTLEFPDYVCQEIINELVHIIMENISDLRLSTHPVVSLSIANPAQALAPEAAGQSAQ